MSIYGVKKNVVSSRGHNIFIVEKFVVINFVTESQKMRVG
jgi:hypothetical protein